MALLDSDIEFLQAANMPDDETSTAGGSPSSTLITTGSVGEFMPLLEGGLRSTADVVQYQLGYLKNDSGTDSFDDVIAYNRSWLTSFQTQSLRKITSNSASDGNTKFLKLWGIAVPGGLQSETIVLSALDDVMSVKTWQIVYRAELRLVSNGTLTTAVNDITIADDIGNTIGFVRAGLSFATNEFVIGVPVALGNQGTWANRKTAPSGVTYQPGGGDNVTIPGDLGPGDVCGIYCRQTAIGGLPTFQPVLSLEFVGASLSVTRNHIGFGRQTLGRFGQTRDHKGRYNDPDNIPASEIMLPARDWRGQYEDPAIFISRDHVGQYQNPKILGRGDHVGHYQDRRTRISRDHKGGQTYGVMATRDHVGCRQLYVLASRDHISSTTDTFIAKADFIGQHTYAVLAPRDHHGEYREPDPGFNAVVSVGATISAPWVPTSSSELDNLGNVNILRTLKPWVRASGPFSGSAKIAGCKIDKKINGSITGSLSLLGKHDTDFGEFQTITITQCDGRGNVRAYPPMVAESRTWSESSSGPRTEYSLMDLESYRLSESGKSLPTLVRSTSRAVAEAVGSTWGVRIVGAPDFPFLEEDIKDSDGWSPLKRLAAVEAAVLVVNSSGAITFVPNRHTSQTLEIRASSLAYSWTPSATYTGFQAVKTSSIFGATRQTYYFNQAGFTTFQLQSPLRAVSPTDYSVTGGVQYLALFDGPVNDPGSNLVGFFVLGGTPVGLNVPVSGRGGIARYASLLVVPDINNQGARINAVLQLDGAPPEPDLRGTERAFVVRTGSGRRINTWREQLLPSVSFVQDRLSRYLWEASKGAKAITFSANCNLDIDLFTNLSRTGLPSNQVGEVSHSFTAGSIPTTTGKAFVL